MWIDDENPQDPYNRANPQNPVNLSVGAGGGSGTNPTGTTSNPSTQTPVQPNQPNQQFATVQDYLGANKQQGENLGQQFTSNLGTSETGEKQAISKAGEQAKGDITAGSVPFNAGLSSTAVTNPTAITNNPGQLQDYLKQWGAQYTGPASFEASPSYSSASTAASEANTKAQELATAGGQQQLLQDQFNVYGQGNKGLDQAVLQNSTYYPKVQQQQKDFGDVQSYLTNTSNDVNAQASKAAADTAATKSQTQNALAGNLSNFQAGLTNRVNEAQTTATTQANKFKQDLASGDSSTIITDLKQANPNVDATTIQRYLDAYSKDYNQKPDLSNQYNFNPNIQIDTSNVASPQDYANAAAWQQLTGQNYSGILDPNNAAKAGTAPSAISGLNPTMIQDYLKSGLQTQDTNLLANQPSIVDPNTRQAITNAPQLTQQYIDASQRQGIDYKDSPNLQLISKQAQDAIQGAIKGGMLPNDPRLAPYNQIIKQLQDYGAPAPTYPGNLPVPGQHQPSVPIDKLLNPTPIGKFTPDTLSQELTNQAQRMGGNSDAQRNLRQEIQQIKDLYQGYLDKKISADQYSQLQNLLKRYDLRGK